MCAPSCRPNPARRNDRMIRVVIADDQALVRGGLRMILETQADIEVAGEAADSDEAVAMARELAPDVILMDIRMPAPTGSRRHARSPATARPATGRTCSSSPHSTSTITYTRR